jgi:hypothetical protein
LPDLTTFDILSAHLTTSEIVYGLLLPNSASRRSVISTAVRHSPLVRIRSMWFSRLAISETGFRGNRKSPGSQAGARGLLSIKSLTNIPDFAHRKRPRTRVIRGLSRVSHLGGWLILRSRAVLASHGSYSTGLTKMSNARMPLVPKFSSGRRCRSPRGSLRVFLPSS